MFERKLNGILADEMGLGKTIQTIALLAHLACEKGKQLMLRNILQKWDNFKLDLSKFYFSSVNVWICIFLKKLEISTCFTFTFFIMNIYWMPFYFLMSRFNTFKIVHSTKKKKLTKVCNLFRKISFLKASEEKSAQFQIFQIYCRLNWNI